MIRELYSNRLKMTSYSYTDISSVAYDAVWALAIALNKTANQFKNTNSCCKNWTAQSVTTESLIEQYLEETDFYGYSVNSFFALCHIKQPCITSLHRVMSYLIAMDGAYILEFTSTNLGLVRSSIFQVVQLL